MKNHYCNNPQCLAKVENEGDLCDECLEEEVRTDKSFYGE